MQPSLPSILSGQVECIRSLHGILLGHIIKIMPCYIHLTSNFFWCGKNIFPGGDTWAILGMLYSLNVIFQIDDYGIWIFYTLNFTFKIDDYGI